MGKSLSIITGFGCDYQCKYCIMKSTKARYVTPIEQDSWNWNRFCDVFRNGDYDKITVSGGGDPFYNFYQNKWWFYELFEKAEELNTIVDIHTAIIDVNILDLFNQHQRQIGKMIYHITDYKQLYPIQKVYAETVRVVFVVEPTMEPEDILAIYNFVNNSNDIDQLSFRELVDFDGNPVVNEKVDEFLNLGDTFGWWKYIHQADYNDYYIDEQVFNKFLQD